MNIKPPQNCNEYTQATLPAWSEQGSGHYETLPPSWIDHPVKEQKPVESVPNAGAWVIPLIAGLAFIWKVYLYWR